MGRKEWYRSLSKGDKEIPGCMSGMFHLFDFRHSILFSPPSNNTHNFNTIHSISSPQLHPQLKGVEAPRNSLELDESAAAKTTSAAEEYYGVPFGIRVQKKQKDIALLVEEEKRSSSPRTPNLVAKLMGLDMIPDGASTPKLEVNRSQTHSPKVSSTKKNNNSSGANRKPLQRRDTNVLGSRSLPDTPRVSSERFRDGDPRLSFQTNKENVNISVNRATYLCDVQSLPPSPTHNYSSSKPRRSRDGSNSSCVSNNNGYAKEIVKQVKENISSKSRRTRVVDEKKVLVESNYSLETPKLPKQELSSIPYYRRGEKEKEKEKVEEKKVRKCKKASCEKFTERIKRQPPPCEVATQSEALFCRVGKHKTTSLCTISTIFSVSSKNGSGCSSHESTKSIASSTQSPLPVGRAKVSPVTAQHKECITGTKEQDPEFIYIKSMMGNYCNNTNSRTIDQFSWYSPSLPIDPLVFHHLEFSRIHHTFGSLQHKCNRKLLFNLVEEILADFLNTNKKESQRIYKDELLERIWSRIKSFPLSNCQVIEDIDALVAQDLSEANIKQLLCHQLVVAELEAIAFEIEDQVIDSVVEEVVTRVDWI